MTKKQMQCNGGFGAAGVVGAATLGSPILADARVRVGLIAPTGVPTDRRSGDEQLR